MRFDFEHEPLVVWEADDSAPDIKAATPQENFGCLGRRRILNRIFEDIPMTQAVWQPDVLWEARNAAHEHGIRRIVDIGCGSGEKLVHYFNESEYETVGVDFQGSLDLCREQFPGRRWLECDLTSFDDLLRLDEISRPSSPAIYVLSDVIEHLSDPRPLLAAVRRALLLEPSSRFIISTPDRALLDYDDPDARPDNDAHLREWTIGELVHFLRSSGFVVERAGHTRANQFYDDAATILVEASCNEQHYLDFLQTQGLLQAPTMPTTLLVTTEYAGYRATGGIGSFVQEQRLAYGIDNTLVLFDESSHGPDVPRKRALRLLGPEMLFEPDHFRHIQVEERFFNSVQHLLYYFPDLQRVEYADYQGSGFRIAQGKRAGLLPASLRVVVHCHGTTHYLENGHRTWFGANHFVNAEKEKIAIELADTVVYPTRFLHRLHAESGIVPKGEQVMMRYPYHAAQEGPGITGQLDTLVFYGKRSEMKGFGIFLEMLCHLVHADPANSSYTPQLKNIVIIGPLGDLSAHDQLHLHNIRGVANVIEYTNVGRDEAMTLMRSVAAHAVCVMPYLADNHPYALLDAAFAGTLPLMVDAGGVGEMYPPSACDRLLAKPNVEDLKSKILELFSLPVDELTAFSRQVLSEFALIQRLINAQVAEFGKRRWPVSPPASYERTPVAVIVPVFNMPLEYLGELINALNHQTHPPQEVIFIDDCSPPAYSEQLPAFILAHIHLPFRVLRHEVNRGLAATRNTGFQATTAPYVVNVDADDIPLNDFVRDIAWTLDHNPEVAAAIPYLAAFTDGDDHNDLQPDGYVYRALGDGVIASQVENHLGHANSGYRRSALVECGGWDAEDRSMWEDYALYLRLASAGHRLLVIPKISCLYRVRTNSMLRTYNVWPAMQRIARNMQGLSRYENFRLQSSMRHYAKLRAQYAELTKHCEDLQAHNAALNAQLQRRSVRAIRAVSDRIAHRRAVFKGIRSCGLVTWKAVRYISRLGRR